MDSKVKKMRKIMKLSEIEDLKIEHSARCQIATDKNLLTQTSLHFCEFVVMFTAGPQFCSLIMAILSSSALFFSGTDQIAS